MIFFDTETCGFHGPVVLLQWAEDDGPVSLHSVWTNKVRETMELIEEITYHEGGVCGFNLAFDWFHLCQLYTTLRLLPSGERPDPEAYALKEPEARFGPCLKPQGAFDIMLHARKGPYQSTMDRKDIKIKRVPTALAWALRDELDARIPLKDIYFARKKDVSKRWDIEDIIDDFGNTDPDFKNIILRFAPSSALKALAQDALGIDTEMIKFFADVEPPRESMPEELGYAPFALAIGQPGAWNGAWPDHGKLGIHITHWAYNEIARKYATDDVRYLQQLYDYFERPPINDDDSILSCVVGAVRWRGFKIDVEKMKALREDAMQRSVALKDKFNFNSPKVCKTYLMQAMDSTERLTLNTGTKSIVLEGIAKWKESAVCEKCNGAGCNDCEDGLVPTANLHPAAVRAKEILAARRGQKEIELYDKLIQAGRFHASFNVIGTFTSRMSGSDGLNPQGIKRGEEVRSCFTLADDELILCGGDFDGFEVCLADAVYGDPELRKDLQTGKKIHALFGMQLFPGHTYEEIVATKDLKDDANLYTRAKNGVFAMLYGGESFTLQNRVGISAEAADEGYQRWIAKYKVWGEERKKYFDAFCSMRQPGGIGTVVEWHEPQDYIESMFGFRRYFTLENKICKTLFELANEPPKSWNEIKIKVVRREREQTATGAVRSALFASAFALQAANMRAAANHVIQSSGAQKTKELQVRIWTLQPAGINHWRVQPLNIHDEVMAPTHPSCIEEEKEIVKQFLDETRPFVPLIAMKWKTHLTTWADK